jgi:hypothetical protein
MRESGNGAQPTLMNRQLFASTQKGEKAGGRDTQPTVPAASKTSATAWYNHRVTA